MTAWPHSTWLCSGLYVEGMDSDGEDPASLERRWLKPIYSAAPKLILRHALLCCTGWAVLSQQKRLCPLCAI